MKANQSKEKIRVVILLGAPLTTQNFERIGVPYLSKHFEVIIFDCMEWLGRNQGSIEFQKKDWHYFSSISSEMDFSEKIEELHPHYVINFIELGVVTLGICKILAKNNIKFVVQKTGTLPIARIDLRIKNMMIDLLFRRSTPRALINSERKVVTPARGGLIKLVNKILFKINSKLQQAILLRKLGKLPNYICLIAGYKSLDNFTRRGKPIIWICSNDYHTFNKVEKGLTLNPLKKIHEPFILFIDDCVADAHDWILLDIPPPVTSAAYFSDLNDFFEKNEAIYGMPVKIAGHPNSVADENYQSKMGGRSVIFDLTAELTLQLTIVLTHASTATSFAVLAKKPIISLTTHELNQSPYGLNVKTMSKSLGTQLIFIDSYSDQMVNLKTIAVNKHKYNLYKVNYLCNEHSKEMEPWGGFIEYASYKASRK